MEQIKSGLKIIGKIELSEADLNKKRFSNGRSQYNHIAKIDKGAALCNQDDRHAVAPETVDRIYKELGKVERSGDRKGQINDLRTLLEFAFALRLYPSMPFAERKATKNLAAFVEEYYMKYPQESSAKFLVGEIRKRLNHIIHNSIFMDITEAELNDLFLKVHCILDGLFDRDSKSDFSPQPEFYDINKEQRDAVSSHESVVLVNAGPGTGKTHLIVDRIRHSARNAGEKVIIALAYTNEAAKQLKDRYVYSVFGTNDYTGVENVYISTIHSFAFNTMKSFFEGNGQQFEYEVIDDNEEREINEEFNNNQTLIAEYLKENKLLTFNGILAMFDDFAKNDAKMRQYLKDTVYEIILDEAQDASLVAAQLLKDIYDIAPESLKIFLVGDQRQNIFAFNTGSILNFGKVGLQAFEYQLHRCYRCPNTILNIVNRFSFQDCTNVQLDRKSSFGIEVDEEVPEYTAYPDEKSEISGIIAKIKELRASNNVGYSDMAILLATSYSFRSFAECFNAEGIPFRCYGGHTEILEPIRQLLYYLGAIEKNRYSFKKFIAHANVDFGTDGFRTEEEVMDFLEKSPEDIGRYIQKIKYYRSIIASEDRKYDIADAIKAYSEISDDAALFEKFLLVVREAGIESYKELKQKMSPNILSFEPFYNRANIVKSSHENDDCVAISTIHSAKGKEWQYVFIPGVTDGKYPAYIRPDASVKEQIAHENNEMKKFYVACTRSLKKIYFSWTRTYMVKNWSFKGKMSKYLEKNKDLLKVLDNR